MKKIRICEKGSSLLKNNSFRTIKLIFLFSLFGLLQLTASGYSESTKLSLVLNNVKVSEVLDAVEKQSEFRFAYSPGYIDLDRKVSVDLDDKTINEVLSEIFQDTDVVYEVFDRHILLHPKNMNPGNEMVVSHADVEQQGGVSGKVTDEVGDPLPGVTVVVKGTTQGTVTNIDGDYSIGSLPANATLVFSFVGMQPIEVVVGNQTRINIHMEYESIGLDEVVAVGYGVQRKETLTGAITGAVNEEIIKAPVMGVSNAIAGLLPGVVVSNRSGQPGHTSSILIRGRNTTGDNNPLVVVDGIPGFSGWQYLNSEDIEAISVLKDASAAIYGAQAANGVILITTKRGKAGKPTFNYTLNEGVSQLTRIPEMADAVLYAQFANEYRERFGQPPLFSETDIEKYRSGTDPFYPNTDWYRELLNKFTPQRQHSLSMSGGTDRVNYLVSGSYSYQDGIFKTGNSDFSSYSLIARVDGQINDNIKVGFDINSGLNNSYNTGHPFYDLGTSLPTVPVYWPNGEPSSGVTAGSNPAMLSSELSGYISNIDKRYSAKASLDVKLPWVEGLGADGYFVYVNNSGFDKTWRKPYLTSAYSHATQEYSTIRTTLQAPELTEQADSYSSTLTFLRMKFERRINEHYVNAFLAFEQSIDKSNYLSAGRKDFYSDVIDQLFAGGLDNQTTNGSASESARQNFFGRVNYNFKDRYLLDLNFRYDGSSNFPKGNRWGFFPGVSIGWIMSEEDFIKNNTSMISNLKLRASYGQIGNDRVPAFQWLSTYSLGSSTGYTLGRTPRTSLGLTSGVTPNTNITWEVAELTNLGVDGDFWNGLLGVTFDVFKQKRSNILAKRDLAIPGNTGLILPNENIGEVENKGFELELSHRRSVGDFSYRLGGNIAFASNEILFIDEAKNIPEWQKSEGNIIGAPLLYKAVKIIRTEEELESIPIYPGTKVGDLQYEDVDGDGIITDKDMVRVNESSTPEITFGFNVNASYKRFSLWAHFTGQTRAWVQMHKYSKGAGHNSLKELLENRYTPGSMDSKYPWIPDSETRNMDINGFPSTFWQLDASFLRLKSLELSYNLPVDLISRIRLSSMQVSLSGSNLFTIDKLKWYDPEGDNLTGAFYPQSKVYSLGLKISF